VSRNLSYKIFITATHEECKSNAVLCARLEKYCLNNGHTMTRELQNADFIIVNTCGAIQPCEKEAVMIFRNILGRINNGVKILSVGCLNKINRELIEDNCPGITIVEKPGNLDLWLKCGQGFLECDEQYLINPSKRRFTHHKHTGKLARNTALLFGNALERLSSVLRYTNIYRSRIPHIIDELTVRNKVYVQIGSGCVNKCNYCAIKKAKGDPVSRSIDDVMSNVRNVYQPGKVLCLVADDCGCFGIDTGETLFDLVYRIHEEFPEFPVDISNINPYWILRHDKEYTAMLKKTRIYGMDTCLQSGSNKIIKKMNRNYDVNAIVSAVQKMRKVSPETFIWTHFIVGYPSETWHDFVKTIQIGKYFDFHPAFDYSPRNGTKGADLYNNNSFLFRVLKRKLVHIIMALRLIYRLMIPDYSQVNVAIRKAQNKLFISFRKLKKRNAG